MDKQLYNEFVKAFANMIKANEDSIADIVDYDDGTPLYEYYHSRFNCDTYVSEDAMWRNFWADFEEAFATIFKDYI